jgi:RHS repeat-associated protein
MVLENKSYDIDVEFDSLGRLIKSTSPLDITGKRAVLTYEYGAGGGVTAMKVDGQTYVSDISYDSYGRRVFSVLGNGTMLRYLYDRRTLRLRRLRAEHAEKTAADTWTSSGRALQDYCYRYDPGGNLLTLADFTPGCGLAVENPNQLIRQFTYDLLDRLASATGRESGASSSRPWLDTPRSVDITKAHPYRETYEYDIVGNLSKLSHIGTAVRAIAYTRSFLLQPGLNRLGILRQASGDIRYAYDACGNLTSEATNRFFEWNHANQMVTFRNQAGSAMPSIYAQYRYDHGGRRIAKLVRKSDGWSELTIYIGGFERTISTRAGKAPEIYDSLELYDSGCIMATLRRGRPRPDDRMPEHPIKYHLADHLHSNTLDLSVGGVLLHQEEYLPYGETSFGSYTRKRYRFTGKERDSESGLLYHGARYYAPWIGRWWSCDFLHAPGRDSPYTYASCQPTRFIDPTGKISEPPMNQVRDVLEFEAREAAFAAGPAAQSEARGSRQDPFAKGRAGNAIAARQGQLAMLEFRKNLEARARANTFPDASRRLLPEPHIVKGKIMSVAGNPKPSGRNPDVGILKTEIKGNDPPAEWKAKIGAWAPNEMDTTYDLKVGGGYVRDKPGFGLETGLGTSEVRPFSRARERGFATLETCTGTLGLLLTAIAVRNTAMNLASAYRQSQESSSSVPIIEQSARESGSWAGGFLGSFVVGALVGAETGPGALLTGLIGGFVGSTAGHAAANEAIEAAWELKHGFDAFVKPIYSAAPSPWGG